ncbi:MAG: PilN domain-containing protein [Desulfobulbus sp.]|nr:PilN domain-containing protein [Desulfobulbus sp.]
MIQINLLPVREIKKRARAKKQIIISSVSFFGLIVLLVLIAWYQNGIIADLNSQNTKIQKEKTKFQEVVNQIKKIDEEKALLDTRIKVIKTLKQESSLTVHVLDEIANLTPSNRMWLKSLSQSASQLSLNGMALDDQTIAKFMDDLEASRYIKNVHLANTTMDRFAERNLKSFSISCAVGFEENTATAPEKK